MNINTDNTDIQVQITQIETQPLHKTTLFLFKEAKIIYINVKEHIMTEINYLHNILVDSNLPRHINNVKNRLVRTKCIYARILLDIN